MNNSDESLTNLLGRYSGFRLFESPLMVRHVPRVVNRSWTERLFSRPWRPWVKERVVIDIVPMEKVIIDYRERVVIGHPKVIKMFKEQLQSARVVANDCNSGR